MDASDAAEGNSKGTRKVSPPQNKQVVIFTGNLQKEEMSPGATRSDAATVRVRPRTPSAKVRDTQHNIAKINHQIKKT